MALIDPVLTPGNRNTLPNPIPVGGSYLPISGYNKPPVQEPQIQYGSPNSFDAAAKTNAGDYDKIMADYRNLLSAAKPVNKVNFTPIAPQRSTYQPSPALQSAMNLLSSFSSSGGYTSSDLSNIRARGVSPIRAVYANAQRNLLRQKNLQGGYSPNYAPASAKMARELSEELAQANTGVEASIADNVAKNRLAALGPLASVASAESNARNAFNQNETQTINEINRQNSLLPMQYAQFNNQAEADAFARALSSIEGMRSLYGTSPALVNTFGNQVAQQQQLKQNQQQINNTIQQGALNIIPGLNIGGRRVALG